MLEYLAGVLLFAQPAAAANSAATFEGLSAKAVAERDAGHLDAALNLYAKALKVKPSWDEGWWTYGSIAYDRDQYSDCSQAFRRLAALKPDLGPGWIMSGLCEYGAHNYEAARTSLLQAQRLKFEGPTELSRSGRLHLALVLTKTGAFERAIVLLTELTRMDRKTPEIGIAAGIAGLRKTWIPSGVPEASRDLVAKLGDAMATAMEMDVKGATEKFEALIQEHPSEPDVHYRFGAFLMQQTPERGISEIRQTLELEPAHVPALIGLAMIYLKNGDAKTAFEYSRQAVKADTGDYATHVALGRALLEENNAADAADELRIAVKLAPESAEAHFSLASAYTRLGQRDDAQREQEEFRRLRKLMDAAN